MTRPWREEIAEALRRHQAPIGLGNEMPGDEYDCCADVILAKLTDLLGSDEVREAVALKLLFAHLPRAQRDWPPGFPESPQRIYWLQQADAALAVLREMVGGA